MAILGDVAPIVGPAEGALDLAQELPIVEAVIDIIRRHPMRETELIDTLSHYGKRPDQVQATLDALEASGQAQRHIYRRQTFWTYAGGRFAALEGSRPGQGIDWHVAKAGS